MNLTQSSKFKHVKIGAVLSGIALIVYFILRYKDSRFQRIAFFIYVLCMAYFIISGHLMKKEGERIKARKREIITQIAGLAETTKFTELEDDITPDDLFFMYEVTELEKIVSTLKSLPKGHRRLQTAVEIVDPCTSLSLEIEDAR